MTPEDEEFARIDAEIKRRQGDTSQPVPVKTYHDCDQCKAVQEPVLKDSSNYRLDPPGLDQLYTTPPAQQPVPVKTYHDGKPWPVAPKPWVGLTDEQIETIRQQPQHHKGEFDYKFDERSFARAIEAKLREKNGGAA